MSKALIVIASVAVLSGVAVGIASLNSQKTKEPVVIVAEEKTEDISYVSPQKEERETPAAPAEATNQPIVQSSADGEGEEVTYAVPVQKEPAMSPFHECSEDLSVCSTVSESDHGKYMHDLDANPRPEVVGTYSGSCNDGTLAVSVEEGGIFSQVYVFGDEKIDLASPFGSHGWWRVADGKLIPRTNEGNIEFRPRTMQIAESALIVQVPFVGSCMISKR